MLDQALARKDRKGDGMSPQLTVLSLGAGVQSTTLALMAAADELPRPDCAIFADTGAEPASVYQHLDWLENILPYPVHRVRRGDLQADCLANVAGEQTGKLSTIPAFTRGGDGRAGILWRECTSDYKIAPITAKIRELCDVSLGVERWLGISTDEAHRMKPSRERWATNRWPLIEAGMSRADCLGWLARHGFPSPPKSACIFCPYHSDTMWRDLRDNDPVGWQQAVAFDAAIRSGFTGGKGEIFLHRSLQPLDQVDLRSWSERGQPDLFGEECEGMCGT